MVDDDGAPLYMYTTRCNLDEEIGVNGVENGS